MKKKNERRERKRESLDAKGEKDMEEKMEVREIYCKKRYTNQQEGKERRINGEYKGKKS